MWRRYVDNDDPRYLLEFKVRSLSLLKLMLFQTYLQLFFKGTLCNLFQIEFKNELVNHESIFQNVFLYCPEVLLYACNDCLYSDCFRPLQSSAVLLKSKCRMNAVLLSYVEMFLSKVFNDSFLCVFLDVDSRAAPY